MRTLIVLLLACSNMFGQYNYDWSSSITIEPDNPRGTRVDTTYGMLVYCVSEVKSAIGVRIDSVETNMQQIPCPDSKDMWYSCSVLHYGLVDNVKSCNYYILDVMTNGRQLMFPIDEKYILKFIP